MQGRAWVLGSMLELQNTRKIRLYSEMSSAIMFCICCFPHKGENGCTFSSTFLEGFFFCLTCVPSAPMELQSALRHALCRINCAFLKRIIEEFSFAWLSCSFLRHFSIFSFDFAEFFFIQFSNFTTFPIF